MVPTILKFAKKAAGRTICAALLLGTGSAAALAQDPRCEQLVALHRQYAGVTLTSEQQVLKRKLVAWYGANCGGVNRSAAR